MAYEKFTNAALTTLSANVNNSSDPVTLSVTSAAAFPASGNFRILIGTEYLKVTSVSGSNFTCARAQEGSSIASHTSGDQVTLVVTAGGLDQTIKDRLVIGALTNYNADNNMIFQANDTPSLLLNQGYMVDSPYSPLVAWNPDGYTWFSQGSSTYTKNSGFTTTFSIPTTSGEQLRGIHIATSGSKTIDAWFQTPLPVMSGSSYNLAGVHFGNGSNSKKTRIAHMKHISTYDSIIMQYFTDDTTPNTTVGQCYIRVAPFFCLRMVYDSGANTIKGYYSHDGINFLLIGTRSSASSDFTPNRAGLQFENNGGLTTLTQVSNVNIY